LQWVHDCNPFAGSLDSFRAVVVPGAAAFVVVITKQRPIHHLISEKKQRKRPGDKTFLIDFVTATFFFNACQTRRLGSTRMNNRLGDLPAWAMEDSDDSDDDVPKPTKNGGDIEMQEQKDNHNHYMENFFREVDSVGADIDAVSQASKDIAKINEASMRATTTAEEQKLSKKLKPLIETTNKRAKRTKNLLGLLKEETEKLKADGTLNSSDIR
jgi:hypothetical protein